MRVRVCYVIVYAVTVLCSCAPTTIANYAPNKRNAADYAVGTAAPFTVAASELDFYDVKAEFTKSCIGCHTAAKDTTNGIIFTSASEPYEISKTEILGKLTRIQAALTSAEVEKVMPPKDLNFKSTAAANKILSWIRGGTDVPKSSEK